MSKSTMKDALTGLPNHDACVAALEGILSKKWPAAIALADLDDFGDWNEARGAKTGDALIRDWSTYLHDRIDGAAELYRFGGDALMVVWPDTEKEQAFLAMESARDAFAAQTDVAQGGSPTFSTGVAASPEDGEDAETLVRKCSEALYRAKLGGRNKVCLSREEKMVTKTVHYRQGQLEGLTRLSRRESMNEASLLREALDDLLRKYNA